MFEPNIGIYSCGGKKFHSKVRACSHGYQTNQPVEWWFHNETFQQFPWQLEPTLTLDQLYDARARELREKYDYLLFSYSGGSDSHNMVQAFIRQGLHIDEILTNHMTEATRPSLIIDPGVRAAWNFNAEHELNAVPRLKDLTRQLPKTKFTVVDVSDIVLNSLQQFDDVHWVLERNLHLSIGQTFRYNYFRFDEIKKNFDRGKRAAIVVGVDKPTTIVTDDDTFKVVFPDGQTNISSVNEFNSDYSNVRIELFYWSDTTCPLIAKQAHTIMNWLKEDPARVSAWKKAAGTFSARRMQEPILRKLLYTTWDANWFQTGKASNPLRPEFDNWFHKTQDFKRQKLLWERGVEYLDKIIPDYVTKNDQGDITGVRGFTHSYEIGKI